MNDILFTPTTKQDEYIRAVFDPQYSFLCYGGAAGGGKTFVSLAILILFCRLYPKSRWCVIRRSLTEIKLNTIPSFWKVAPTNFIKQYNKSDFTVTFNNDSQIIFKGENIDADPELFWMDGLEVNGFLLEQVDELSELVFRKAKLRAGRNVLKPMPPIKILMTVNPCVNWARSLIWKPYSDGTLKPPYYYLPAFIADNTALPDEYLDSLQHLDIFTKEKYVHGNWNMIMEGVLFRYDQMNYFTKAEFERDTRNADGESLIQTRMGYIDPSDGGKKADDLSFPVGQIMRNRVYITDAMFTRDSVETTPSRVAEMIRRIGINYVRIEKNGIGSGFIRDVKRLVGNEKILSANNQINKAMRIWNEYGFIKTYFYFLAESEYRPDSEYDLFLRNFFSYLKKPPPNSQDGAPDSAAGLSRFIQATPVVKDLFDPVDTIRPEPEAKPEPENAGA